MREKGKINKALGGGPAPAIPEKERERNQQCTTRAGCRAGTSHPRKAACAPAACARPSVRGPPPARAAACPAATPLPLLRCGSCLRHRRAAASLQASAVILVRCYQSSFAIHRWQMLPPRCSAILQGWRPTASLGLSPVISLQCRLADKCMNTGLLASLTSRHPMPRISNTCPPATPHAVSLYGTGLQRWTPAACPPSHLERALCSFFVSRKMTDFCSDGHSVISEPYMPMGLQYNMERQRRCLCAAAQAWC